MSNVPAIEENTEKDIEKEAAPKVDCYPSARADVAYDPVHAENLGIGWLTRKLLKWGVETRGGC